VYVLAVAPEIALPSRFQTRVTVPEAVTLLVSVSPATAVPEIVFEEMLAGSVAVVAASMFDGPEAV
jgi:hypothetical protein